MAWLYLLVAGLFEIGWAVGLRYTDGFTRFWPSIGTAGAMAVSVFLLARALQTIPSGPATPSGLESVRWVRPHSA